MKIKFRSMVLPLMAGALAFSCEKNELNDMAAEASLSAESVSNATSNIIYTEKFEGSTVFDGLHRQLGTSHAFNVATSPVFDGSKSGRFELRDSDPIQSGGTRAEVLFPEQANLNRWYGFSVYFPSADYARDSYREIINQWHQGGGLSPTIALEIRNDRYEIIMPSGATGTGTSERIDLGPVSKDTWNAFAFHIKHSAGSDGILEIWLNGKKILNRAGANMYPSSMTSSKPRWKLGIYKWLWNDNKTTDTKKRVLYYDNIRLGNENATLSDIMAGVTTTAPAPTTTVTEPVTSPTPTTTVTEPVTSTTPTTTTTTTTTQKVASFTLVNSSTDKDVMTVTDGATLNLSTLGITKFNIRANTSPSVVGSVRFELTGTQSRNFTDSKFPYSVQGDDGASNYYYGNWEMPKAAGTYTLKVTPYTLSSGGGQAGASTTIRFTIK